MRHYRYRPTGTHARREQWADACVAMDLASRTLPRFVEVDGEAGWCVVCEARGVEREGVACLMDARYRHGRRVVLCRQYHPRRSTRTLWWLRRLGYPV